MWHGYFDASSHLTRLVLGQCVIDGREIDDQLLLFVDDIDLGRDAGYQLRSGAVDDPSPHVCCPRLSAPTSANMIRYFKRH